MRLKALDSDSIELKKLSKKLAKAKTVSEKEFIGKQIVFYQNRVLLAEAYFEKM